MKCRLRPLTGLLLAVPSLAHVMSMSTGDLKIDGNRAHYELRMPLYEMSHVADAEQTLLDHIQFSSGGGEAKLTGKNCRESQSDATYLCTADYEFPQPVDKLDVACTFHSVTVPNHVHLLRAVMGERRDQAIFDLSFPNASA